MSTTATSIILGVAPAAIGAIIGVFVSVIPIAIDSARTNWRKRFRQQVKLAIQKEALSFEDLEHLSERWFQDRKAVLQSLRVLLSEAVSGEDLELAKHCNQVRELLSQHLAREPYSELPENISLQLKRLTESQPESGAAVTQLAASLSELYSTNQRELQTQKKFSLWGFIIGIVGVVLSIPGLYVTFKP